MTCLSCHTTQRPAAVVMGFDHTLNGNGDCRGCHQATVVANRYVDYFNPSTMMLPGGDWQGGRSYPGDVLVTSSTQFVPLTTWTLTRGSNNLVTGITSQSSQFYNAMLHTSPVIPAQLNPGSATMPDNASCWHCHTHATGFTTVTAFSDGKYHQALSTYSATPGGAVMPLAQPTTRCLDCHEAMRPSRIVQKAASAPSRLIADLRRHGHHRRPERDRRGGPRLLGATAARAPAGPTAASTRTSAPRCRRTARSRHYPLMATAQADVSSGTTFSMSTALPSRRPCSAASSATTALGSAATTPIAATLGVPVGCTWLCTAGGLPRVPRQRLPRGSYPEHHHLRAGDGQHRHQRRHAPHRGRRRGPCAHLPRRRRPHHRQRLDRSSLFHPKVANPAGCATCHGTANGRGTTVGTNNNLPAGLTSSRTTTTASSAPGVKDQLT